MKYLKIEKDAVLKMFKNYSKKYDNLIIQQFNNSSVRSRDFTGGGFYTLLDVKNTDYRLPIEGSFVCGDITLEKKGQPQLGFNFYIKDGFLAQIECYMIDDNFDFNHPGIYEINYTRRERDIPIQLL